MTTFEKSARYRWTVEQVAVMSPQVLTLNFYEHDAVQELLIKVNQLLPADSRPATVDQLAKKSNTYTTA
jgi:hypothetical protein